MKSDLERWERQARRPVRPYGKLERSADAVAALAHAMRVMGAALVFLVGFWLFLFGGLHLLMWVCRLLGWSDV